VGNVSTSQAFARALGEAQRRASARGAFPLSLDERIQLLKVWILPWLLLTSRTYCSDKSVDRSLRMVYKTALALDSWRVTLTQLTLPSEEGGYSLALPETWLRLQAGLASISGGTLGTCPILTVSLLM